MRQFACGLSVVLILLPSAAVAGSHATGLHTLLSLAALGQDSLLDLGEEEEKPLGKPTGKAAPPAARAIPEKPPAPGSTAPPNTKPAAPAGVEEEEEQPLNGPAPAAVPGPAKPAPSRPVRPLAPDLAAGESMDENVAYDVLYSSYGRTSSQAPLRKTRLQSELLRPPFPAGRSYEFFVINPSGKGYQKIQVLGNQIVQIVYCEERMLRQAANQFGLSPDEFSRPKQMFPLAASKRQEAAEAALAVLQTALAEHDSAVQRSVRRGPAWAELRRPLAQARFNLRISQLHELIRQKKDSEALALCGQLSAEPDGDVEKRQAIRDQLARLLLEPAEQAVDQKRYAEARQGLDEYLQRYPQDPGPRAQAVRSRLVTLARELVAHAERQKDPKLLEQAAAIWPQLAGLDETRRKIATQYPILNCVYPNLPRQCCPLTARNPVERHAVALMYESLVRWRQDPIVGPHYVVQLADGRPVPLAKGREFRLPRCVWSDSTDEEVHVCTREDVRWTLNLLKQVRPLNFSRAWGELVTFQDPPDQDPFLFSLKLERDHWQPLSFMDFAILAKPKTTEKNGEQLLNLLRQNPVGTGPFRLLRTEHDAKRLRFVANPFFRTPGLPKIREVVFHQLAFPEAKDEFIKGNIQLFYGVPKEQVVQLRNQGKSVVKLPPDSVYFLAPNYRRATWRDVNLRLALAHAIDRETILQTCFRPGDARQDHAALTGPFPQGSWACNPKVPAYTPNQAAPFLRLAQKLPDAKLTFQPLTLIYPDRDPDVGNACKNMTQQWAKIGIMVLPEAVDPADFPHRVVQRQDFDLAYWRHDFNDESYWLRPLFDPRDVGAGGTNFMGYREDQELEELFKDLALHKDFRRVRELTHALHDYIARKALLIPLWQLDTYVAVSPLLQSARFDPITLFREVEQWTLVPP